MAKTALARRADGTFQRGASAPLARARTRTRTVVKTVRRRASAVAGSPTTAKAMVIGGAAAIAFAERGGTTLPTVANIDPALLYGLALGFGAPMLLKGKAGAMLAQLGLGAASVGVHRSIVRGSARIAGDEDDGDDDNDGVRY